MHQNTETPSANPVTPTQNLTLVVPHSSSPHTIHPLMRLLARRGRRNHPVPHGALPVRDTNIPNSNDNHPYLLAGHEATPPAVLRTPAADDALPPQEVGAGVKRVGLEVLGAVEALLV